MFRLAAGLLFSFNVLAQDISLSLNGPADKEYGVVGSVAPLNWQAALPMTKVGDTWSLTVNLDASAKNLDYKYVVLGSESMRFEPITGNRVMDLTSVTRRHDEWAKREIEHGPSLAQAQIREDIATLKNLVSEISVLAGIESEKLQAATEQLITKLDEQKHYIDWYQALKVYLHTTTKGLVDVNWHQQDVNVQTALAESNNKLPFEFEFIGNKMFVSHSPYPEQLPVGAEILKLNQKFVWQVLELFKSTGVESHFQSQLGSNHLFEVAELDLQLASVLPPLANGYVVTYQGKKKPKTEYLPATSWPKRQFDLSLSDGYLPDQINWSRSMQTDKIAYLQLASSSVLPLPAGWQDYLVQSLGIFEKNKVGNVIIDLRKVTDSNLELYQFLLALFASDRLQKDGYVQLNLASLIDGKGGAKSVTVSHNVKRPEVTLYSGQVFILYSANNDAGLGYVLSNLGEKPKVSTVGSRFQYDASSIASNKTQQLRLKNSGIVVSISNFVWRNKQLSSSIKTYKPTTELTRTPLELKQARDGVLLKLIGLINQSSN